MWKPTINQVITSAASLLFFSAWWIMIDIHVQYPHIIDEAKHYYVPPIFGTFALILSTFISNEMITGASSVYYDKPACVTITARIFLFVAFTMAFGCVIYAVYIMIADFLCEKNMPTWPGVGIFLLNVMILGATMILKFLTVFEPVW